MSGMSANPPRPICRKFSAGLLVATPPVHHMIAPWMTSIVPSVTMKEGTRSSVVANPLTRPTRMPIPTRMKSTGTVFDSSAPTRCPTVIT